MKTIAVINLENTDKKEALEYKVRNTARGVVFDNEKKIALMKVIKGNFHKLPGGGIENNEQIDQALIRECQEEAGVVICSIVELGLVTEIKKVDKTVQNSYCYMSKIKGEKGLSHLTKTEKENGFEVIWVELDEAIRVIKNDGYSNINGKYIYERELAILTEVLKIM